MIVAITSSGNNENSLVDQRFGRCAFFALYNTESKELEFVKNENQNAEEGAGPASVAFVANKKVEKIISGEFGYKIKGMLNDLNIQMVMLKQQKTVKEIIHLLN